MDKESYAASFLGDPEPDDELVDSLCRLVFARHRLISVESSDEQVELQTIRRVAHSLERTFQDWTLTTGIQVYSNDSADVAAVTGTSKLEHALQYILRQRRPAVYCLRDVASLINTPVIQRSIRDFVEQADPGRECLILLSDETLHPRIQKLATPWRAGLPGKDELREIVKRVFRQLKRDLPGEKISAELRRSELEQLIANLRGLTRSQAANVIETIILDDRRLDESDLQRVINEKRRLLESAGCLESMSVDFDIDEVGGLSGLKAWLSQRRHGFSERARRFGITPPRGVLMLGVPGCGKSLCAKAVAADWGLPLLRLDPGLLYQKFVGESENQLRQAIRQAEAMAPVVLWIDEIEKAFASASASSADGGLSQRMFGTLLSWMQDHREPIFIVATANDISSLPPELMRKGRFDEVFFIDLPQPEARAQIFMIHLKRRNRDPADFQVERLVEASDGLTGAEIEQSVGTALFQAFHASRDVTTDDIVDAIRQTQPLSVLMEERIQSLRNWASGRCVPAG